MTSIEYEDLFSDFLGYVTDYTLLSLSEEDAYGLMSEYLRKSASLPYVRRLFSSLSLNDDFQIVDFEMLNEVDEASDLDFTSRVLTLGMVVEWLRPQVRSKNLTAQMFGGKEQKYYSQQAHLSELRNLLEDTQLELRKVIRDRGYIYNTYLGE